MSEQAPPQQVIRTAADWEALYDSTAVEAMPWFYDALDPDVERAIVRLGLTSGRLLDLGTGPGTQAILLSVRGFEVTASDVSASAVAKAQARAASAGANVAF